MFDGINLVALLGTTFFMMASATVWFSPLLFGKYWLQELNVTESEIEASRPQLTVYLGATALLYGVALTVLAQVIVQVRYLEVSFAEVVGGIALLVVAILGNTALWENRSRVYVLINAGFYTYFVIVGMLLLNHWPW